MHKPPPGIPNELLTYEREKQGWTQQELADKIDNRKEFKDVVTVKTIQRWEKGSSAPTSAHLGQLCKIFNKSPSALGCPPDGQLSFWHVPHQRNKCFTEREDILQQLHDTFLAQRAGSVAQRPLALRGLGGVGKSQIAAEYAYRCRRHLYGDSLPVHTVLWLQASTRSSLNADVATIARVLDLPGKNEANIKQQVGAFKAWLTELTRWLLIFDDIEDFDLLKDILPDEIQGRVLLTTHSQPTGTFAEGIPVEPLDTDAGAALLLHRAKRLPIELALEKALPADVTDAHSLSDMLGGLPLALDQAGAYVEETGVSLPAYRQRYQRERHNLLNRRGGVVSQKSEHPESVVVTLSLSVQKACEQHPLARDILDFCTFLRPDAIPEELFQYHEDFPFGTTAFDENVAVLLRYSLVKRHAQEQTLSMHRLVQAVLQDTLKQEKRRSWIQRAVQAVNASFPGPEFEGTWPQREWPECERLVSHGIQIAPFTETEQIVSTEAGTLLHKTALYLWNRRDFTEVERLYQQALQVRRQLVGPEHPDIAASLNGLANLYYEQSLYTEAESLYQQALQMRERLLGLEHPDLVSSLNGLAKLSYYAKANYAEAESHYLRAIRIAERHLGQAHPHLAYLLMNLANLYADEEKYEQAEPRYKRALRIWEQLLGPKHPSTALACNNLGALYLRKHDYVQAEACFLRARQIWEELLEKAHPYVATALNNLGDACREQHKYTEAEPLYQRAMQIFEERFGPGSTDLAYPLTGLADTYRLQERFAEALHHYKRALRLRKKAFGLHHPGTADTLDGLGQLREAQGHYEKARILYAHVRAVREQVFGLSHSSTVETYQRFIALLHTMGLHDEAAQLEATLQTMQKASEGEKGSG